jgi:hypothetical protein
VPRRTGRLLPFSLQPLSAQGTHSCAERAGNRRAEKRKAWLERGHDPRAVGSGPTAGNSGFFSRRKTTAFADILPAAAFWRPGTVYPSSASSGRGGASFSRAASGTPIPRHLSLDEPEQRDTDARCPIPAVLGIVKHQVVPTGVMRCSSTRRSKKPLTRLCEPDIIKHYGAQL